MPGLRGRGGEKEREGWVGIKSKRVERQTGKRSGDKTKKEVNERGIKGRRGVID